MNKLYFLLPLFSLLVFPISSHASGASCTVSLTPSTLSPDSTSTNLTFSINNTGSSEIDWVYLHTPSDKYTIVSFNPISNWDGSNNSNDLTISGAVSSSSTLTIVLQVNTGSVSSSASWTVQASDEPGGTNPQSCTGSAQTTIAITPTATPATVTETKTVPSVVISFDSSQTYKDPPTITGTATDNSSNITSADYSTDSGTIWNSITLDTKNSKSTTFKFTPNLKSSGSYSVKVRARNSQGNYGFTSTFTLTLDRTPPTIKINTDLSRPFTSSPTITGTATDISGISAVSYSIDGENFLPVDSLSSNGKFEFTPITLDDGSYSLSIKAADSVGNYSLVPSAYPLTIDRLPPQVGLTLFSLGPLALDSQTAFLPNLPYKITLSAIGGPTSIKINNVQLTRNPDSNLWSTNIPFPSPGEYSLIADSIDSAANRTTRAISTVSVLPPGQTNTKATISVYYRHPQTQSFVLWDAAPYSQSNPLKANPNYSLFLPPGTYYIKASAPGFVSQTTTIFTLSSPAPITPSFTLRPANLLHRIFFWLSDLTPYSPPSYFPLPTTHNPTSIPPFQLSADSKTYTHLSLRGQPALITFLSSWSPFTSQQLAFLKELPPNHFHILVIFPQESETTIALLKRRGLYSLPLIADPDGILVTPLGLTSSPTHLFVDRKGTVLKTVTGLLTTNEILDYLKN